MGAKTMYLLSILASLAIPGVPILGNLHQLKDKKPFKAFYAWAQKYGPIYTIKLGASTMVVINSSEIAKEVSKSNPSFTHQCAFYSVKRR